MVLWPACDGLFNEDNPPSGDARPDTRDFPDESTVSVNGEPRNMILSKKGPNNNN